MKKCLVTKLNGQTNNPNLLKVGEMRIHRAYTDTPSADSQMIVFDGGDEPINLEIIGNGNFVDSTLQNNLGKTVVLQPSTLNQTFFVSNGDLDISISNKYLLRGVYIYSPSSKLCSFDISHLKYSKNIKAFSIRGGSNIYGDISDLSNLEKLKIIIINDAKIYGDINSLSKLSLLEQVGMLNTIVHGDISQLLKNMTNMVSFQILSSENVTCNITKLNANIKLKELALRWLADVSGDISQVSPVMQFVHISCINETKKLTWTQRNSECSIFGLEIPYIKRSFCFSRNCVPYSESLPRRSI